MESNKKTGHLVKTAFGFVIFLSVIGLVVVMRRALSLTGVIKTYVSPKFGPFDKGFAMHPVLTFVHIIPGALFMILAPLQFIASIRNRHIRFHRWSGRFLVIIGIVIGITALTMSFMIPIGGTNEATATISFALLFLYSLGKGFYHIRRREINLHREWMLRMFAIGMAIATVRPIVGLFFALSKLPPHEFFGIAFWLGFTIHLVAAESWILYFRKENNGLQ